MLTFLQVKRILAGGLKTPQLSQSGSDCAAAQPKFTPL
jgi:hypothetical protein